MKDIGRDEYEYYVSLDYPVLLTKDPEDGFLSEIPDLPGCISGGDTAKEALEMIEDAKRSWVEAELEEGRDIPLPEPLREYSGRFVLRVPKALHRRLSREACEQGVSLNTYIVHLLSERGYADRIKNLVESVALGSAGGDRGSVPASKKRAEAKG